MIVPVMAISNLVLTRQIYFEETNGAHTHNRDHVCLKEKVEYSYKTNHYFAKFLKNQLLFPTRKENHGKEPVEEPTREQRFVSCMAFSVLASQGTRTTS